MPQTEKVDDADRVLKKMEEDKEYLSRQQEMIAFMMEDWKEKHAANV